MRILLTGCNGNLGSYIKKESSDDVIGVGRDEWPNIEDYIKDDIDTIIHAAYDLKSRVDISPENLLKSNILNTAHLIELAKKYKVRKFVFVSSCAVYGNSKNTQEDQSCAPVSTNGIVKLLNEKIIQEFCNANGIKCEIYRLFNMYGGKDSFSIINYIKKFVKSDLPLRLNNKGSAQRDFIHVTDIAKIILGLMKLEHNYECVNVGTGVGTKIIDIVKRIQKNHPDLEIENNESDEVGISIANVERLHSLLKYNTIDIIGYVSNI